MALSFVITLNNWFSFIHSSHFYSASSSPQPLRGTPDYSTDIVSEFHAGEPQTTVGKGLAKGPYVADRAGVEPTTLRLRVIDLTNAPPRPTICWIWTDWLVRSIADWRIDWWLLSVLNYLLRSKTIRLLWVSDLLIYSPIHRNVPSKLCTRTQAVRRAHTRKLGRAHINVPSGNVLHTFHTRRCKYRRVLIKCCTKEILCAQRLWKIRGNIDSRTNYLTEVINWQSAKYITTVLSINCKSCTSSYWKLPHIWHHLWRFGVKLRHSIRAVSGALLSRSGLEEAL